MHVHDRSTPIADLEIFDGDSSYNILWRRPGRVLRRLLTQSRQVASRQRVAVGGAGAGALHRISGGAEDRRRIGKSRLQIATSLTCLPLAGCSVSHLGFKARPVKVASVSGCRCCRPTSLAGRLLALHSSRTSEVIVEPSGLAVAPLSRQARSRFGPGCCLRLYCLVSDFIGTEQNTSQGRHPLIQQSPISPNSSACRHPSPSHTPCDTPATAT